LGAKKRGALPTHATPQRHRPEEDDGEKGAASSAAVFRDDPPSTMPARRLLQNATAGNRRIAEAAPLD
jgi:hypothetical protein